MKGKTCVLGAFLLFFLFHEALCQKEIPNEENYFAQIEQMKDEDEVNRPAQKIFLSDAEVELDKKLNLLQKEMLQGYKDQHFFPPARYYYASQSHVEQSTLFKLIRKMPKGGVLHMHFGAMGDLDWFIDKAKTTENCYVFWDNDRPGYVKGQLKFFEPGKASKGFVLAKEFFAQGEAFEDTLRDLISFDQKIDRDSVDIWKEFEHYFSSVYSLFNYEPLYKEYCEHVYRNLLEDGIQHVELRMNMASARLYDLTGRSSEYNIDTILGYHEDVIQKLRKEYPAFTVKYVYTSLRFFSRETIRKDLVNAFSLRKRYPNRIIGYDLVAEEDAGNTTRFFVENWLMLDSLEQAFDIDMPLYLHDGESNWASNDNLYDAVLLGSKRIGHGYNLFRYPSLWEKIKEQDICLEICPLSNQLLGYVRDLRNHPGALYMDLGIPVSISSDDPGPFRYKGTSPDFWSIFLAWELDLRELKWLCKNSLVYSGLSLEEKELALIHWEEQWKEFVAEALVMMAED